MSKEQQQTQLIMGALLEHQRLIPSPVSEKVPLRYVVNLKFSAQSFRTKSHLDNDNFGTGWPIYNKFNSQKMAVELFLPTQTR